MVPQPCATPEEPGREFDRIPAASLLAIGNELLNGEIRDINLHTLSRRLTRLGFNVRQAAIAQDTISDITASLNFLLCREPDLLICCGGLGPTEDDRTLMALAQALSRPLAPSATARRLIESQYKSLQAQGYLNHRGPEEARSKMARLPEDAKPLPNPVGTAPGVKLQHGRTLIYVLPGVPAELEAIFDASIIAELQARFELGVWVEGSLRVHVDDEAEVAAPLREVQGQHSAVYLKSLAQPFPAASREGLRIIAAALAREEEAADKAVEDALYDLRRKLEDAGLQVSDMNRREDDTGTESCTDR